MTSLRSCCITGYISQGTPTGEYIKIGGVDAYVAKPEEPSKAAIVISTDVFGYKLPNVQLIADTFAQEGFYTIIPDIFNGGWLPYWILDILPKISGIPGDPAGQPSLFTKVITGLPLVPRILWFTTWNPPGKKVPILEAVIKELKATQGFTKVGAIGYCYGGGPVFALAKKPDVIDTFVVAHTKVTVPADITTNAKPGLILAADADFTFNEKAREEAAGIIEKEGLQEKMQMKVYPGTFHGFAIRGDDRVEAVKKAKEEAFYDATKWFKKHLV